MPRIETHPVLDVTPGESTTFLYEGQSVTGEKGFTIAAALHQAGFPVHSHSLKNRTRSLECGIGKCGACEMLVDGVVRRICITKVDGVRDVREIPRDFQPTRHDVEPARPVRVFRTDVAIIGGGPAGLAARAVLQQHGVNTLLVDGNDTLGGQVPMQTHKFFFFEEKPHLGGLRGDELAATLAGEDGTAPVGGATQSEPGSPGESGATPGDPGSVSGIFLNSTVWDLLEGRRLAIKNLETGEIFYIETTHLIVATGAVPFMPPFKNDDMPGVYTAAVIQKMMNTQFTLLGQNILTVGAGNIGYLTSYQLIQAGAKVRAIVEARGEEGGFPVQANRIRRLGVPILLSHAVVEAIPNAKKDGITGAVVARFENGEVVRGSERRIDGIDAINICTGLVPDNRLLEKGYQVFGRDCLGAGDAERIGEGTSAVLRGRQVAYEILDRMRRDYDYNDYLKVSKQYIDSQQRPVPVIEKPAEPVGERRNKPFVIIDCTYGFACNPCAFACEYGAITKSATTAVPEIDYDKCVGCMKCIDKCPGLAIVGMNPTKGSYSLPVEFHVEKGQAVELVDNDGRSLGTGIVQRVRDDGHHTRVVNVISDTVAEADQLAVRGVVLPDMRPPGIDLDEYTGDEAESESYLCHCDDVKLEEVLEVIGDRRFISIDEVKHTTRLGMGACRGKRCIMRLKQTLRPLGIQLVGTPTPRAPLSSQLELAEIYPRTVHEEYITPPAITRAREIRTGVLVAGGGIGGSALFRYLAEAGMEPVLVNFGHGASWRNIAGGRPTFSLPELSDIAANNRSIFSDLQNRQDIGYQPTRYVTFAHDEEIAGTLKASMAWSNARMITPADFASVVSPSVNGDMDTYIAALVTEDCWQANPGKVVDLLRTLGMEAGGDIQEDCRLVDVSGSPGDYRALVRRHDGEYVSYRCEQFINALGPEAEPFAAQLGMDTGLYAVRHQAFITRRLPLLGPGNTPLPMMIDRRRRKGFSAIYGQQLADTGQVIGCASPAVDPLQTNRDLKVNSREFLESVSEVFVNWVPAISSAGLQAAWAGCYVEPRMIIDPARGLFVGLRGQGFMLGQYLAKIYVDFLSGRAVPDYLARLALDGDGLREEALK